MALQIEEMRKQIKTLSERNTRGKGKPQDRRPRSKEKSSASRERAKGSPSNIKTGYYYARKKRSSESDRSSDDSSSPRPTRKKGDESHSPRSSRKKEVNCFGCGKPGVYRRDCPRCSGNGKGGA